MTRFIAASLFVICASCTGDAGTPASNGFDVKSPGYSPDSEVWYVTEVGNTAEVESPETADAEDADGPDSPELPEQDYCAKFKAYGLCQTWYENFDLTSPTEVTCESNPDDWYGPDTCGVTFGGAKFFGTSMPLEKDLDNMQSMLEMTFCPTQKEGADNSECLVLRMRLTTSTKWFYIKWFWHP